MRYYIIAGEPSGDLHASNLVKAIRAVDPQAVFRGIGGDKMKGNGVDLLRHYNDIAFMGFAEEMQNIGVIRQAIKQTENDLVETKPDVLIAVDYPGFNLRMMKFAKQHDIKTVYYISPKLWAWRASRVETIKRYVDHVILIFPFEEAFYKKHGYANAHYVGNPLLDELKNFRHTDTFRLDNGLTERAIVALLPGSRKQEIEQCLPPMLETAAQFPTLQFVVAGMEHTRPWLHRFQNLGNVKTIFNQTYDLLAHSDAALVTSGTATLEAALLNVPQVCAYRTSSLTYWIGKRLVKVPYISLVNLIAEKPVVSELIQADMNTANLSAALRDILPGGARRETMLRDYEDVRNKLRGSGASDRAAKVITEFVGAFNA